MRVQLSQQAEELLGKRDLVIYDMFYVNTL